MKTCARLQPSAWLALSNVPQQRVGSTGSGRVPDQPPLTQRSLKKHRAYEAFDDFPLIVTCPSLPGLVTYGETLEEARAMAVEAIEATSKASKRMGCRFRWATCRGRPSPSTSASSSRRYEPAAAGDDGAGGAPDARAHRVLHPPRQGEPP